MILREMTIFTEKYEDENAIQENSNYVVESRQFSMSCNSDLSYCTENFNIDTSHHRGWERIPPHL